MGKLLNFPTPHGTPNKKCDLIYHYMKYQTYPPNFKYMQFITNLVVNVSRLLMNCDKKKSEHFFIGVTNMATERNIFSSFVFFNFQRITESMSWRECLLERAKSALSLVWLLSL